MVGIKDFEMPHNCYDCEIHNYHECDLTSESIEEDYCWNGDRREKHCPLREVEAIPKADYEARLKADMVAMLEDLDLQIDESAAYNLVVAKVQRLIRYKIDKLKREDLPHCQHTDEKIAKSFIEDVEAVKDQLPTTKNNLGVDCIARQELHTSSIV